MPESPSPSSSPAPAPAPAPASTTSWLDELALATVFLTRLPLVLRRPPGPGDQARSMAWFPLVGAGIGVSAGGVFWLAEIAGLPATLAALLAVASQVALTGGLHEDGLADTADGFGAPVSLARKLEIMRDSRIGSFGVLALGLTVAARVAAIAALGHPLAHPLAIAAALATSGAWSRAVPPVLIRALPPARADGLAVAQGRPSAGRAAAGVALALGIAGAALGVGAAAMTAMATGMVVALVGHLARRQIGGYTGDVLGAAQQLAEVAVLLTLVARP